MHRHGLFACSASSDSFDSKSSIGDFLVLLGIKSAVYHGRGGGGVALVVICPALDC